jgi:hypothetical protein
MRAIAALRVDDRIQFDYCRIVWFVDGSVIGGGIGASAASAVGAHPATTLVLGVRH